MTDPRIEAQLDHVLSSYDAAGLGAAKRDRSRDVFNLHDNVLVVFTDRITVAGKIVGLVPFKGEVCARLTGWWLDALRDEVHVCAKRLVDPQAFVSQPVALLPHPIGVWGELRGALARAYEAGHRSFGEVTLADGLSAGDPLPAPVISAWRYDDDDAITLSAPPEAPGEALDTAARLFTRGRPLAEKLGLALTEAHYRFGRTTDGHLTPIGGLHTPDTCRYRSRDGDFFEPSAVQAALRALGWAGGEPPTLPVDTCAALSERFLDVARASFGEASVHVGRVANRLTLALSAVGVLA